ncbi:DNA replication and repair protein RecF [Tersicoccus solisilvae]|uniref:DNA replication and repair protein RecF n=1 Tax=Tersicoccus solisilvae TaxID=1882339 RepID=A0ABQ1NJS2_9MICC|nr:DNA replication/repair protein RecF [Tersicoccus solisilvae]GGC78959.1 DNA replication and repair protein RecF [Tersicoccus solisilvae]
MHLAALSLTDFRTYAQLDLTLEPGVTVFVGANGLGKTNIVEAVGYLATLGSHRVSQDAPLIRFGAQQALVRARLVRRTQQLSLELEINARGGNRVRINRANPVRAREALGLCRTVLFAPEDLDLVKGDPGGRRRFLDELTVTLAPAQAALRGEYDRVLKQRNALLKSARAAGRYTDNHRATLQVWNEHLAATGAQLLQARVTLLERLAPHLAAAYRRLTDGSKELTARYRSTVVGHDTDDDDALPAPGPADTGSDLAGLDTETIRRTFLDALEAGETRDRDRALTLTGPHRDDIDLVLGQAPAKGYASHGESWSVALSLRLAAYELLREDALTEGGEPILLLDDVFAELDADRRNRLAAIAADAEQVLITAAVVEDIPASLIDRQLRVGAGVVEAA